MPVWGVIDRKAHNDGCYALLDHHTLLAKALATHRHKAYWLSIGRSKHLNHKVCRDTRRA